MARVLGPLTGCHWWPSASTETEAAATMVLTGREVSAPAGSDIRAGDTLLGADGVRWDVIGDPFAWTNIFDGAAEGVIFHIERAH